MNRILWRYMRAILGLIGISIAAFSLLFLTGNTLAFAQNSENDLTSQNFRIHLSSLDPIGNTSNSSFSSSGTQWVGAFETILRLVSNFLLIMIPTLAGVSLIIAGYFFIFSGWEGDRVTKGKNIIKFNLIAIVVAFLSWSIINLISTLFK